LVESAYFVQGWGHHITAALNPSPNHLSHLVRVLNRSFTQPAGVDTVSTNRESESRTRAHAIGCLAKSFDQILRARFAFRPWRTIPPPNWRWVTPVSMTACQIQGSSLLVESNHPERGNRRLTKEPNASNSATCIRPVRPHFFTLWVVSGNFSGALGQA
jgi:hypothetical protein